MQSPLKGRDPLAIGTELLALVAYSCSYMHVQETVAESGQAFAASWFIAAMPEISTLLCILKIRRDGVKQLWPWIVGGTAAAFTISANLYQAEVSAWGWIVAGWPAWAALGAMAMLPKKKRRRAPARKTAASKPRQLRKAA